MHTGIRLRLAAGGAALLALAACGGGGGGSGSTAGPVAGPAPAPAPTPTPVPKTDPPATDRLPPAPFGLQASANFAIVGWQQIASGGSGSYRFDLAQDRGSLAWSASEKTYLINLADLGSGRLVYTFPVSGNNNLAFSIIRTDGSVVRTYVTLIPRTSSAGEIYWQSADGVTPFTYARAIFGLPVPAGGLPASGTKTFVTDSLSKSGLVFDFANRTVSGTLTTYYQDAWSEGPTEVGTVEPAVLQADGSFVARLTVAGSNQTGELRGRLLGPHADELGIYWNAPVRDGYGGVSEYRTVRIYEACTGC